MDQDSRAGGACRVRGLRAGCAPGSIKLDKLHVHPRHRGKGYGSALIRHVEQAARARRCGEIYLQVNKYSSGAINGYLRNGFAISRAVKVDIGGGFFMDDYVMEKALTGEQ
ncbi:MAG TPA: GNAT family N-acetyltransferase [Burkholderiales bacterium]|jgi:GNAT superfamily N-acetyltransferase|nr:GNAT family N-acetyltransferase [Burkholderiales bacterium]